MIVVMIMIVVLRLLMIMVVMPVVAMSMIVIMPLEGFVLAHGQQLQAGDADQIDNDGLARKACQRSVEKRLQSRSDPEDHVRAGERKRV